VTLGAVLKDLGCCFRGSGNILRDLGAPWGPLEGALGLLWGRRRRPKSSCLKTAGLGGVLGLPLCAVLRDLECCFGGPGNILPDLGGVLGASWRSSRVALGA